MLKKELIETVKINQLFHEISKEYGYDVDDNGHLVVEYIGIYHARLRPNFADPLVVINSV